MQGHFLLVKETILSNKFAVFTISESWLDTTVSDLEIEIPGYNITGSIEVTRPVAASVHMSQVTIVQNC